MNGLRYAVARADIPQLKDLLSRGANVNLPMVVEDDRTLALREEAPLVTAARLGHLDVVRTLLEGGADINIGTMGTGMTALHWACARGNVELSRFLVTHGAKVDKTDYIYETPLLEAICSGRIEIVKMLVTCGADMNRPVNSGHDSSLFFALYTKSWEVARFLIAAGANVHTVNNFGEDLLWSVPHISHYAEVIHETYQMLLDAGCHPTKIHIEKVRNMCEMLPQGHILRDTLDCMCRSHAEPQSLQHLCRLSIRKLLLHLSERSSVIGKCYQLPIPWSLQKYLALGVELDQYCLCGMF